MTNPKLNDLQLILLATAVRREDGSILPPPDSLGDQVERIRKAIPALMRRQLIEEIPVTDQSRAWREEDQQPIGLVITSAGRVIIAAEETEEEPGSSAAAVVAALASIPAPRSGTKTEQVLNLLRRPDGSTLIELVDATGWLSHSTRAALTGLRKKGHIIEKIKRDDATCYRIGGAA